MTAVLIKSDSDKKTELLVRLAEELGLSAQIQAFEELTVESMVKGIGRKATDAELIDYLSKGDDEEPIDLGIALSKYLNAK